MMGKLERIIIEDDVICDYCNRPLSAGSTVFARFDKDSEGIIPFYWCSQECLDNYEAEEFEKELIDGLHETSEDYFKDYIEFEEEW